MVGTFDKVRLGISTCLLGEKVRYDGQHKLDTFLRDTLGRFVEYVAVCPEVECGLPIPREAMRLEGDPENPRLMTHKTRRDLTEMQQAWGRRRLQDLESENLDGYIFKSKSPSSGLFRVKVYQESGMPVKQGVGIWAKMFTEKFPLLPVEEEGRLNDPVLRENFIERIFVMRRWREMLAENNTRGGLVDFHTRHKYLILAHSQKAYADLGRIVAGMKGRTLADVQKEYLAILMPALELEATVKKNVNVLQHLAGYFKKQLSGDEKKEMTEVLAEYARGSIPLIVPVTLIRHYVRKYGEAYLANQWYLHPHPLELQLRNHA
ncbi:MAG: YbgA family protein [Kiritimatiellia bacterium]